MPRLLDRDYYEAWREAGALSLEDKCRERKQALLASPEPEPLAEDLAQAMDEAVAAARRELGGPA